MLKKQDIKQVIIESYNSKTSFYTGLSVLLNGFDKTSLELVQMGKRNKVKNRLRKKYNRMLSTPLTKINATSTGDIVWTSWLQGEKMAPQIVQKAIQSLRDNFPEKRVVVIDMDNLNEYVSFPDSIIKKWKSGAISNAHFSDLLRLNLLITYGGIWVDATVFVKKVPECIEKEINSKLFFFQNMRPGQSGNAIWLSSWFISARKNEPVLVRTYELLMEYWEKNNHLIDYFLFHIIMHLVLENNEEVNREIKKIPNSLPLMLMYQLRNNEDSEMIQDIFNRFPIQKVTYKKMPSIGSNYNYLENHTI